MQDTDDQLKVNTGITQTFEQYCSLLISAATSYDNIHKPKGFSSSKPNNNNRRVYQHDINNHVESSWGDQNFTDTVFDANTNIQEIQAYSTKMQSSMRNQKSLVF